MVKCQYKAIGLLLLIVLGYLFVLFEVQSLQADIALQSPKAINNAFPNLRKKIPSLTSLSAGNIHRSTATVNHSMSIPGLVYGTAWKKERTKVCKYWLLLVICAQHNNIMSYLIGFGRPGGENRVSCD
jgi:hypothetical protein